jgi:DNA-binding response OmpR family regulator
MVRNLLNRLLTMEGYEVSEAGDGQAALDSFEATRPTSSSST